MAQIRSHTGLRGVAALLVVFYHLSFLPNHFGTGIHFIKRCYLLVDLFFVLSGFIISHAYESPVLKGMGYIDFAQRRLVRLVPLNLFCLAYLICGQVLLSLARGRGVDLSALSPHGLIDPISQALLFNAFLPFSVGWNVPTWSISAELCAYALFPLVVRCAARNTALTMSFVLSCSVVFYLHIGLSSGSLDIIVWPAPLRCLAGFFLGMWVFRLRHLTAKLSGSMVNTLQVINLLALAAVMALQVNDVAAIPLFASIAFLTCDDRGWLSALLRRHIAQYLGEISYSVYLNHVCLLTLTYPIWTAVSRRLITSAAVDRFAWTFFILSLVIAISHMTYKFVETPARQRLTRWLQH